MRINTDRKGQIPGLKRLGFDEANELLALARADPDLPCKVIDDGCHERAEVVLMLAIQNGIDPILLRRAFLFNTEIGNFLSMDKPLIEPIKAWFANERELGRLVEGAKYLSHESVFTVDSYGALRADAMPSIYLDDAPKATWGVGHVAVMVGHYIVDTAFDRPATFEEWQSAMALPGGIPLLGHIGSLPELHIEGLDELAIKKVESTLVKIAKEIEIEVDFSKYSITDIYRVLDEQQKSAFFNLLFKDQIEASGLYTREHWTEVYPGPLTSRGESFEEFCDAKRRSIKSSLATQSSQERLEVAMNILRPFKDYERMMLGYDFESYPPKTENHI